MTNPRHRNPLLRLLPKLAVLAIAGLVVAALVKAFMPQPVKVDLAVVERGPMQVSVEEDGMTRIQERFVVAAPLAGRLQRIQLDPGDNVSAGETLLAAIEPVDPSLLDARAIAEAEARRNAAESRLKQTDPNVQRIKQEMEVAESNFGRAQELKKRGTITQRELDEAELVFRQAQQNYRSAKFSQEVAEFELRLAEAALIQTKGVDDESESPENTHFSIISPITGRVLRVFQESSKVVSPGENLVELGDPTDLEVVVDVLSSDAVRINAHMQDEGNSPTRVQLEHWGGWEPLSGVVRLVEPSGFTKISALGVEEQRVNVVIDFDEPIEKKKTLGDGFRVEARIIVWERDDVLIVPTSALFRDRDQWAVFKVVDGKAVLQPVEIGQRNGLQAELLKGLDEGETVIVHPGDQVEAGAMVEQRN
ncbi:MAG: HlyD family efflux transporter periplasmic adaptor subunit [Planctomycetaceae bacterium]|nr:HlyD family efflux transporter periplasmic adaptor subunit [Planctomycetaceae bacterium]